MSLKDVNEYSILNPEPDHRHKKIGLVTGSLQRQQPEARDKEVIIKNAELKSMFLSSIEEGRLDHLIR